MIFEQMLFKLKYSALKSWARRNNRMIKFVDYKYDIYPRYSIFLEGVIEDYTIPPVLKLQHIIDKYHISARIIIMPYEVAQTLKSFDKD